MTLYDQNAQLWESTEVTVGEGTQEPETESFVSIDFWTMLFTLVNLLLLLAVATKFLFKPVKKMIDSRQKEIDDLYGESPNPRVKTTKQNTSVSWQMPRPKGRRFSGRPPSRPRKTVTVS